MRTTGGGGVENKLLYNIRMGKSFQSHERNNWYSQLQKEGTYLHGKKLTI